MREIILEKSVSKLRISFSLLKAIMVAVLLVCMLEPRQKVAVTIVT